MALNPFKYLDWLITVYLKVIVGLEGAESSDTVAPRTEGYCGTSKPFVVGGG